ncbi:MAG: Abi family protein [Rhodobacteraceae bacterium]|nr:Abi family protein [Paracoccaceae bacterium]
MTIPIPDVKNFNLNSKMLDELEGSLSADRLRTYLTVTGGDRADAVRLYTWNTAISAAFYGPLQALEVALRNAMNRELAAVYGQAWYDNSKTGLDGGCLARIEQTKRDLRKDKYPDDPPHPPQVVASLSFGFWVSLLGPGGLIDRKTGTKANYEMTLWRPALRSAFPHAARLSSKNAHTPLNFLRTFRNRIAHHEPVFPRHLEQDYANILEITSWITPHKREWIKAHSRVLKVLATPRDSVDLKF